MGRTFYALETLSGGVVYSRDPALLEPGQLSDMRNCTYRRGSQALQRSRGREVFAAVTGAAADIAGLTDIQFDNDDHFILGLANEGGLARLRSSHVGFGATATGSFLDVGNIPRLPGAATLEVAHYQNRFYAFQGVIATAAEDATTNLALYLTATAPQTAVFGRQMGMMPVIAAPTVTTATGAFSASATGFYEYWTTEVANYPTDGGTVEVESTYAGAPTTVSILATSTVPTIPRPVKRNPVVNRWRIYRSAAKSLSTDTEFPVGFLIGERSVTVNTFTDRASTATSSYVFPTVAGSPYPASATAAYADGGDFFNLVSAAAPGYARQDWAGFNFGGGLSGAVGIEAQVQAYIVTPGIASTPITVELKRFNADGTRFVDDPVYGNKTVTLTATASGSPQTITLGGATDMWTNYTVYYGKGRQALKLAANSLVDSDFNAQKAGLVVRHDAAGTVAFDYVAMKVYSGGSQISEIPFPAIIVEVGGVSTSTGLDGPPPNSSTGALYNDQMVLNDLSNRSIIRYSAPGKPESFPSIYFLDFETRHNDIVTAIRVVNNRLVVLLNQSAWRVNYLPSESDASFNLGGGMASEPITSSFGCVNAQCVCSFSVAGGQEQIAFVSNHGIHATDGNSFVTLTDDIAWRDIIGTQYLSVPIALVNDPEQHELIFYYRNDVYPTESYLALRFHYSNEHSNGSRLKASGPSNMRNYDASTGTYAGLKSACCVTQKTGEALLYYGYGASPTSDQILRPIADISGTDWFTVFTVAACTLNGTTTVTTTNSFANVSVGATVSGTGITGGTTVATVAAQSLTLSAVATTSAVVTLTFTGSSINRWATTDEVAPAVSTDRIYTTDANIAVGLPLELLLASGVAPNDLEGMVFKVNARKTSTINVSNTIVFNFLTNSSLTPWATRTITALSGGYTAYSFTFTAAERLAVGDFSTISVRVTGTTDSTAPTSLYELTWLKLRMPGVANVGPGAGKVYCERGINIPAADPAMSFTTRRLYLGAGTNQQQAFGQEWNLKSLHAYVSKQQGTPVVAYTARSTKTNFGGEVALQSPERQLSGETLSKTEFNQASEGVRITMDTLVDHNDIGYEFLLIKGESFAEEDSGVG